MRIGDADDDYVVKRWGIKAVQEKRFNDKKKIIRRFGLLPEDEKHIRRGEIYYYSTFGSFTKKSSNYLQLSIDEFKKAYEIKPTARALSNLGVATASLGFLSGEDRMMEYVQKHPLGENFLWCAHIQEGAHEPLYVDIAHYSPMMSKMVARTIYDLAIERNLIPKNDR